MADFTYKLEAEIQPPRAKRGENITISAQISDLVGEVKNVILSVPQYGLMEILRPRGEGKYTLSYTVPWEAPSGNYDLRVYATSTDGERGPQTRLNFTVI